MHDIKDTIVAIEALAKNATPGPWKWFTSNSMMRLSSIPSGKDGDVISAFTATDGVPCVAVSAKDARFIANTDPDFVLSLIAELRQRDERIAELEEKTGTTIGVGDGTGKLLVHGDYDSVKAVQKMIFRMEAAEAELARRDAQEPVAWLNDAYLGRGVVDGEAGKDDQGPGYIPVYREAQAVPLVPNGWKLVPIEPTEDMVIRGFESKPDEFWSAPDKWEAYEAMSGCQQAAHRAKLCWQAMIAAAPFPPTESTN